MTSPFEVNHRDLSFWMGGEAPLLFSLWRLRELGRHLVDLLGYAVDAN